MQVKGEVKERRKETPITKGGGPQCNQISSAIAWKNRKFSFNVCATNAAKAAQKVTPAEIKRVVEAVAGAAVIIDCSSGESCGDTQQCLEGDLACNINVTRGPAAGLCRPAPGGNCTAPETYWVCDIWANVDASKQCGCRVP
jgi:hypothetical protein